MSRNMANSSTFFLLWMLCSVALVIFIQAQQQTGFISIDCGSPENLPYTDDVTNIKYSSDGSYIQTGVNKNISTEYAYPKNPNLPEPLSDLRSFPQGVRNCYGLIAGRKGNLHFIRASFLYGNYDGENNLPEFDLYVGVNFWSSVTFRNASEEVVLEIISMAESDVTNVCLVNKGKGTPFISALELRPIYSPIYNAEFGESSSLLLFKRWDIGSIINASGRYQDDVYDRIWSPYDSPSWDSVKTSSEINVNANGYRAPFEVMKNAARPRNNSDALELSWTPDEPNSKFYVYLYFAELDQLQKTQLRKFTISWNGSPLFEPLVPRYLYATVVSNLKPLVANEHHVSIQKTKDSTLPPILNAVEIYVVREQDTIPTLEQDVDAMVDTKERYGVQRNWVGDPCEPRNYSWEGIRCNYSASLPRQIISLNLSSSGLSGIIAPSIANLSLLVSLDLSNNSLTGTVPRFLEELRFLKYLNLQGNKLSGSVTNTLEERSKAGLLTMKVDDQNRCAWGDKKNKKVVVPIVASLSSVLALLVVFILIWKFMRTNNSDEEMSKPINGVRTVASRNWQYTYVEVLEITENFKTVIGKGGFGTVYIGKTKNGNQVAVKVFSPSSSSQGPKEFQTEAELLMTVHHKNLVSFIGYCDDDNKMALIYEYMANGNLKDYLSVRNSQNLSWERRIQIAIDAAEGLDYLHHGCKPPIIHRDVKSANILLNEDLEAKIADFGLSRVFRNEKQNVEVSAVPQNDNKNTESAVMGTTGYLDPEYYKLRNLNEKSDIYSFGIVLLELITGQPAVLKGEQRMHILDWLRPELKSKDLSRVLDPRLQGQYDENAAWKALVIAISCTASTSIQRPTMSVVLSELKQCLKMELPSPSDTIVVPRNVYSELYSSSEAYSMDSESITYPFPR
ncbi:probable LRR receptor-like serine/threonine-protein kinase At4g29180 [Arachis stenosperma]|uniref:probable LRR receptor-like serine/threonine-protein kinase At4g29180 n=1 Tax=Arachis stenosperma TaxID=217475 RepID=UPI0025ABFDBF|nr:probable LRR receptor-like serine/threonine-protein kinase At4g29180 [Arachis stenosperma]